MSGGRVDVTVEDVERVWGDVFETTAFACHAVSLALVKSGILGESRVARGMCRGVAGQHSWVVVGDDCYAGDAHIVDATLWSYDGSITGVWTGRASEGRHRPHGAGSIWTEGGRPPLPSEKTIPLNGRAWDRMSLEAKQFMFDLAPVGLDLRGWHCVGHLPVGGGWPAREIFEAMLDTPGLGSIIPIDVVGMLTDRNPGGLYLKE